MLELPGGKKEGRIALNNLQAAQQKGDFGEIHMGAPRIERGTFRMLRANVMTSNFSLLLSQLSYAPV
jgi:hypothetical protein